MRKAQFAMEYLLVVGFSLLILIPLVLLLHQEYQDHKLEIAAEHLSELSREMAYQAEKLYYQGAPATTTIESSFPIGITNIVIDDAYIEFFLEGTEISIYAESKVPLDGSLRIFPGTHVITLTVDDRGDLDQDNDYVRVTDN